MTVRIPDLHVSAAIVLGPDAENILAASDTDDSTAHLLASLCELVTDHGHQQVLPVAIRNTLLQSQNPLAALLILFVLPDRTDSFSEEMVIRHGR